MFSSKLTCALSFAVFVTSLQAEAADTKSAPIDDAVRTALRGDYAKGEGALSAISGAGKGAAQLALGRLYLLEGKVDLATKAAEVAALEDPSLEIAGATLRAEAERRRGKIDEAIRIVERHAKQPAKDDAARRARVLLGELRIEAGKRSDAEAPLLEVIADYNNSAIPPTDAEGLFLVGRAATLLRSAKDANAAFQESEKVDHDLLERHLAWSELFLDKFDPGHSEELVKDALKLAPKHPDALVLLARIKLEQALDFEGAEALVKTALEVDPKHPGALAVRAGIALHDMDLAGAEKAIALGLSANPRALELLSLRAAVRFLADDPKGFESAKAAVFAKNHEYSRLYAIVGEFAEWEHRYDDIVKMMREAVKVDPDDSKAWAELGLTLTRNGEEVDGRAALNKAWSKDHFNVRVFNTLNLYEKQIDVTYDMELPKGPGGVFRVRYPKDEKPVLERYVPRLLGEAWGSMKARYAFVPTTPVQIELYADREAFSVRTSGLPNIGIQGVCFGHLVAAMSPKSESFNWGNVLWHELGHVFAIQLSVNHVPRWFTEGLSEYETIARRPEWQRELDPELYLALKKNQLPAAVDMNRAFTHASSGLDVTVAYYAASQMIVFTAERFGMPKIVQALKLWGEGKTTGDVIQTAFGVSASDYDAGFRAWAKGRLSRYDGQFVFDGHAPPLSEAKAAVAKAPNDAGAHVTLAKALFESHGEEGEDPKEAKARGKAELEKALALDPNQMTAHYVLAKIAAAAKDGNTQLAHLLAIKKAGGDGYAVEMALADVAEAHKDKLSLKAAFENAHRFDPMQNEPLKGLFDLANDAKDDKAALAALEQAAPLDQHDRKMWRLLVQRLVAAGRFADAVKAGDSAVLVDIEHPATHVAFAEALSKTGDHPRAVFELESAVLCKGPAKDLAKAHLELATELKAVGRGAESGAHVERAKELESDAAKAEAAKAGGP